MKPDSMAIIILCSNIAASDGINPLSTSEWYKFAWLLMQKSLTPASVLTMSDAEILDLLDGDMKKSSRFSALISRSGSMAFAIEKLQAKGIRFATRADEEYPKMLKQRLKDKAPPLFYYAGNPVLAQFKSVGFVGSRSIDERDKEFTKQTVLKVVAKNFGIISGGAKGVDTVASETTENSNAYSVEFVADSMEKRLTKSSVIRRVIDEKLLILSAAMPSAGFDVGMAMSRNKYIYANSCGTVVVKSDYNKGGTWSGAKESMRNNWCNTFCWDNSSYEGNQKLTSMGAIPIDADWTADVESYKEPQTQTQETAHQPEQMSFL